MTIKREPTSTSSFGVGRRQSHDASKFYARFNPPLISDDEQLGFTPALDEPCILGDARHMDKVGDGSVALVVTSPPYFAGKEYEENLGEDGVPASYLEYLEMLHDVFAECVRKLEPGGRIAVNVANLGRKPYRSLAADVIHILQDRLQLLLRGEVVWKKADGAAGSVAWGSYRKATNPVLRDITERVIIASKGRFDRAVSPKAREAQELPFDTKITADEFMEATLDIWEIPSESARRARHPAPFPVGLPLRLINLYTYEGDLVLDPFMGSGTTLVAALKRGRRPVGYDLEAQYVDIARERVAAEREHQRTSGRSTNDGDRSTSATPPVVDPSDHFQARATKEGKAAQQIAHDTLEAAGFTIEKRSYRVKGTGAQFNFLVADAAGNPWYIDVSGAFTTTRGGLRRTDTVWKTLGRALVLRESFQQDEASAPPVRLLLLTSHLPQPGSEGDKALHTAGKSGAFWDAIEMFDDRGRDRLSAYARGDADRPLAGFWTTEEVEDFS
ncbi:MAG: site-specific DNA-methyltransferase [Acidimicrobiia bacterium]|nr:site-specific DNA-methyltransferase [Acidimicrobiia bacterium]MDX2467796.1 site-specific DNA-methyltransferase [Acidimicrobiia bacterium]